MNSLQGNNKGNKIAGLVVAACLGLSLTTSCTASGSGSVGPNSTTPTTAQNQSQSSLAIQAQTALANYHAVDGAFYDSARLSSSGSFKTKQLGGLVGDVLDTVSGDDNDNSDSNDTNSSDSNATSGNASGNANVGLNVGVGSSTNTNTTSNSTNNNSSIGANTGVNVGVGANTNTNTTSNSGNNNSSIGTGLNTGLNLNTDINADLNSTMDSMQRLNSQLRTHLESSGSVRFNDDNSSLINEASLRTNVENSINSNTDNDLQGFSDNSIMQNGRLNLNGNVSGMSSVQSQQLLRNSNRGFNTSAGQIRSQTNADGSVTNFFGTSFDGNNTRRNVLVADRLQGTARLGSDLMLSESGNGFNTDANRVSRLNADSSLNVITRSTTNFDNGDRIEILEERVVGTNGQAAGNGTLTLTDANGRSQNFDLRTMANIDGSLVSSLQSRDNSMERLMLREDASGKASLSFVNGTTGSEDRRTNIDFKAMLDAMSNFDFS